MKRSRWLHALGLAAALCAAPAVADTTLFDQLGGKPGLDRLCDDFMQRLLADARMKPFFHDVDQAQFKSRLADQLCEVSGGPCRYDGPDMKKAHSGYDIHRRDFSALVEVLQRSMDAQAIPFRVQNKLLARLAPMHRDVVNVE